jgi:chemotaxis family two-component system response regulator Rcp1
MMSPTITKPAEILLVEDNAADARLTMEALRDNEPCGNLHAVENGQEALAWLRQEGEYGEAPRPDIILLDLNMPTKDGRQTLAEIKADDSLKRIPVVVFSTSTDERDILHAYDLKANCYVTKPVDLEQFITVVRSVAGFWLTIVRLPRQCTK